MGRGSRFRAGACKPGRCLFRSSSLFLAALLEAAANDSLVIAFTSAIIPLGVRFDHLRAVVEIYFVTVVVRRVVARSDHCSRAGAQVAHGKRELWHRTRARRTRMRRSRFQRQLSQLILRILSRKTADRARSQSLAWRTICSRRFRVVQIGDKSTGCAIDVEKIHRVRADAGKLRSLAFERASRVPQPSRFSRWCARAARRFQMQASGRSDRLVPANPKFQASS